MPWKRGRLFWFTLVARRLLNSFLRCDGRALTVGILLPRNVFIAAAAGLADWVSTSTIIKYVPYASQEIADTSLDVVGRRHHFLIRTLGQPADFRPRPSPPSPTFSPLFFVGCPSRRIKKPSGRCCQKTWGKGMASWNISTHPSIHSSIHCHPSAKGLIHLSRFRVEGLGSK